jgi:hypothetical protein
MDMRPAAAVSWVLALLSCGPSAGRPIEPGSLLLRIDAGGAVFRDGRRIGPENLPGAARGAAWNLDPVVLDADPSLTFGDLKPLLVRLLRDCNRVNIGFRVRGDRVLTVPIPVDHGCRDLLLFDGRRQHHEHGSGVPRYLWVRLRPLAGGSLRVVGADDVGPGAVEFPFYRDAGEVGAAPVPTVRILCPAPAGGSLEELRSFFRDPAVVGMNPFAELEVRPKDRVGDVLEALDDLRRAAGDRIAVSLRLGPP